MPSFMRWIIKFQFYVAICPLFIWSKKSIYSVKVCYLFYANPKWNHHSLITNNKANKDEIIPYCFDFLIYWVNTSPLALINSQHNCDSRNLFRIDVIQDQCVLHVELPMLRLYAQPNGMRWQNVTTNEYINFLKWIYTSTL